MTIWLECVLGSEWKILAGGSEVGSLAAEMKAATDERLSFFLDGEHLALLFWLDIFGMIFFCLDRSENTWIEFEFFVVN